MSNSKDEIITFKVDHDLSEALRGIENRSRFIRNALLAALDSTCPLCKGLGVLKGSVKRFTQDKGYKIPHMGWNQIRIRKEGRACPLLKGIEEDSYFYFVHSYRVVPDDGAVVASTTDYGTEFASMVWDDNLFAVQFHPEKSQANGLKMLRNFIDL